MTDCEGLEGALIGVADGSASADEAASVRTHVVTCGACAAELETTRRLLGALRAADPPAERPAAFWQGLESDVMAACRDMPASPGTPLAARNAPVRRPMSRLAVGMGLAAAAAIALFYGAMRLRGSDEPEVATPDPSRLPHENPGTVAEARLELEPDVDELDAEQLSALVEVLDEETDPELSALGDLTDGELELRAGLLGDDVSAGTVPAEIYDLPPDALDRLYQELENPEVVEEEDTSGG